MAGMFNGRYRLHYHPRKLGISSVTVCRFSEESDETFIYVLGKCLALVVSRFRDLEES